MPLIGCGCAVCTSEDPRDRRLRTGACLEYVDDRGRERTVLLDATPDLRQQALRAKLKRCDAVVFTHNHVDHTFGVDELRRFNAVQGTPIDVYADAHTMEHLRRVYMHIFESQRNVNDSFVASLVPRLIEPSAVMEVYGLKFTPIPLLHGRLPVLGYRIERADGASEGILPLAYCTDVSGVPPGSWRLFKGVRTLVLDALRKRHHPTHFTVDQAVAVAERVGAERTWFVHMTHDLAHEQTNAELPDRMCLAHDGLVIGDDAGDTRGGSVRTDRLEEFER